MTDNTSDTSQNNKTAPKRETSGIDAKQQGDTESNAVNAKVKQKIPSVEIWALEDTFPEVEGLLFSSEEVNAQDEDVIVALDTNALLLPFEVDAQEFPRIAEVYKGLIEKKRLFIPARVFREYVKNRDKLLASILQGMRDKSNLGIGVTAVPPLLQGLAEAESVLGAAENLKKARKEYLAAIDALVELMRQWRGDDPVTSVYRELFSGDVLVDIEIDRLQVERDWEDRLRRKAPPGYKDGGKSDSGIGDFLIWLTILNLGKIHKKNLIFVTGEEKPDWFIRADNRGAYPRPELIDEYRRASGGKQIKISKLADLLAELEVSNEVVQEVRKAEIAESAASKFEEPVIGFSNSAGPGLMRAPLAIGSHTLDYSQHDGRVVIGDGAVAFTLKFSKASNTAVHFYRSQGQLIARAKNARFGDAVRFEDFDSTSRSYTISVGEVFVVLDVRDYVFVGRIISIKDDSRGDECDELTISYAIFGPGELFRIV